MAVGDVAVVAVTMAIAVAVVLDVAEVNGAVVDVIAAVVAGVVDEAESVYCCRACAIFCLSLAVV